MSRALTVAITTRNRPVALQACLESLRVLANLDPEVLVFDDGSEPEAAIVARESAMPARVIRDAAAPGYIVGRNRLVGQASGAFVLLLDDDTRLIAAEGIAAAMRLLQGDSTVAAVAFAQAEANGRPWPVTLQPSLARVPSVVPSFIGFAHMVRRATFVALGGYRETFEFYGEEKEFCLRLIDAGYQTVYLPDALIAHVTDSTSRDRRRYLRFVARNDCLNSLLNDPLMRLVWMLPARYALYFRMRHNWKIHDPWGGLWLFREVIRHAPHVWTSRRPVSKRALERWRTLKVEQCAYQAPLDSGGAGGR